MVNQIRNEMVSILAYFYYYLYNILFMDWVNMSYELISLKDWVCHNDISITSKPTALYLRLLYCRDAL